MSQFLSVIWGKSPILLYATSIREAAMPLMQFRSKNGCCSWWYLMPRPSLETVFKFCCTFHLKKMGCQFKIAALASSKWRSLSRASSFYIQSFQDWICCPRTIPVCMCVCVCVCLSVCVSVRVFNFHIFGSILMKLRPYSLNKNSRWHFSHLKKIALMTS